MDFPWHVVVILLGGVLLAAALGSKEVFTLLYRLFLLFRMLVLMPLTVIAVALTIRHFQLIRGSIGLAHLVIGFIVYMVMVFILDGFLERLAEKHGVK
ncbi:hypothetical protein, partial [Desulfofundulus sp.]|uniref:hypothetical protein n=1 Tax=Desulfofundulus sp. TaxID=2282750 RepID=UPI003C75F5C4